MIHARIKGTGSYAPINQLSNKALEKQLDTNDDWIVSRTGISSRAIAQPFETTSYMAAEAAKKALQAANLSKDDVDLILVATCTPDAFFPSTACTVQHLLHIKRPIPCFDLSAACSGFVYAMDVAKQYIASGSVTNVLVIGSETMSKAVDWQDRSTCILFGDGAGAVVLSASDEQGILGSALHSLYDEAQLLSLRNTTSSDQNSFIGMRGNEVFKLAVNIMGDVVDEVLSVSQLNKSDIKWLIPHQANIRIIQAIAKKLNLPMSQVIVTIANQGNTSAASIPLAIDYAVKNQLLHKGENILIESFGGGMTWGAMVIRY